MKKYISLPGLANLALGNIELVIDEGRFQVRETAISEWIDTKIIDIAKRYFEVLPYTPLKMIGLNFNSTIVFDTPEEAENCQQLCLPKDSQLAKIISRDNINISASSVLRYPYGDDGGRIMLTLEQPNKENNRRMVNFNYEFDFTNWAHFRSELEKFSKIADYSDSILAGLVELLKAI
ncbi:hypothetical protein KA005_27710 [bacterium]|nr:hypothetical protein [bacterium]